MKHDNYYSYLLSTLLKPSYLGMILSSSIAKLVFFCNSHNLLECSKYALHILTDHNSTACLDLQWDMLFPIVFRQYLACSSSRINIKFHISMTTRCDVIVITHKAQLCQIDACHVTHWVIIFVLKPLLIVETMIPTQPSIKNEGNLELLRCILSFMHHSETKGSVSSSCIYEFVWAKMLTSRTFPFKIFHPLL